MFCQQKESRYTIISVTKIYEYKKAFGVKGLPIVWYLHNILNILFFDFRCFLSDDASNMLFSHDYEA